MSPLPIFKDAFDRLEKLVALHNRLSGQATVKAHLKELIAQQIETLQLSNKGVSLDLIPSEILKPLLAIRGDLLIAGCPVDELDRIIIEPLKTLQEEVSVGCKTKSSTLDLMIENSQSLNPTNGGNLLAVMESIMIQIIDHLYKDVVKVNDILDLDGTADLLMRLTQALELKKGRMSSVPPVPKTPQRSPSSNSGNETGNSPIVPAHQYPSPLLGIGDPPDTLALWAKIDAEAKASSHVDNSKNLG